MMMDDDDAESGRLVIDISDSTNDEDNNTTVMCNKVPNAIGDSNIEPKGNQLVPEKKTFDAKHNNLTNLIIKQSRKKLKSIKIKSGPLKGSSLDRAMQQHTTKELNRLQPDAVAAAKEGKKKITNDEKKPPVHQLYFSEVSRTQDLTIEKSAMEGSVQNVSSQRNTTKTSDEVLNITSSNQQYPSARQCLSGQDKLLPIDIVKRDTNRRSTEPNNDDQRRYSKTKHDNPLPALQTVIKSTDSNHILESRSSIINPIAEKTKPCYEQKSLSSSSKNFVKVPNHFIGSNTHFLLKEQDTDNITPQNKALITGSATINIDPSAPNQRMNSDISNTVRILSDVIIPSFVGGTVHQSNAQNAAFMNRPSRGYDHLHADQYPPACRDNYQQNLHPNSVPENVTTNFIDPNVMKSNNPTFVQNVSDALNNPYQGMTGVSYFNQDASQHRVTKSTPVKQSHQVIEQTPRDQHPPAYDFNLKQDVHNINSVDVRYNQTVYNNQRLHTHNMTNTFEIQNTFNVTNQSFQTSEHQQLSSSRGRSRGSRRPRGRRINGNLRNQNPVNRSQYIPFEPSNNLSAAQPLMKFGKQAFNIGLSKPTDKNLSEAQQNYLKQFLHLQNMNQEIHSDNSQNRLDPLQASSNLLGDSTQTFNNPDEMQTQPIIRGYLLQDPSTGTLYIRPSSETMPYDSTANFQTTSIDVSSPSQQNPSPLNQVAQMSHRIHKCQHVPDYGINKLQEPKFQELVLDKPPNTIESNQGFCQQNFPPNNSPVAKDGTNSVNQCCCSCKCSQEKHSSIVAEHHSNLEPTMQRKHAEGSTDENCNKPSVYPENVIENVDYNLTGQLDTSESDTHVGSDAIKIYDSTIVQTTKEGKQSPICVDSSDEETLVKKISSIDIDFKKDNPHDINCNSKLSESETIQNTQFNASNELSIDSAKLSVDRRRANEELLNAYNNILKYKKELGLPAGYQVSKDKNICHIHDKSAANQEGAVKNPLIYTDKLSTDEQKTDKAMLNELTKMFKSMESWLITAASTYRAMNKTDVECVETFNKFGKVIEESIENNESIVFTSGGTIKSMSEENNVAEETSYTINDAIYNEDQCEIFKPVEPIKSTSNDVIPSKSEQNSKTSKGCESLDDENDKKCNKNIKFEQPITSISKNVLKPKSTRKIKPKMKKYNYGHDVAFCRSIKIKDSAESTRKEVIEFKSKRNRKAKMNKCYNYYDDGDDDDDEEFAKKITVKRSTASTSKHAIESKSKQKRIAKRNKCDLEINPFAQSEHDPYFPPKKMRFKKIPFTLPPEYDPNDSRWTLKYTTAGQGVVELMPNTGVYVNEIKLLSIKATVRNCAALARMLLMEIFTLSALKTCSLTGTKANAFDHNPKDVRPGLNDNARNVMFKYILKFAREKGWPVNDFQFVVNSARNKINEIRYHP